MCEHWMPLIRLPLTLEQFHQLPRHSAFKYEYFRDQAHLTPRPKHYHVLLELKPFAADEEVPLRHVRPEDFEPLGMVMAGVFSNIQPFGSLDKESRWEAVRESLNRTRTGGDGPWVEQASFVALERETVIGAILITLLPEGDPRDFESYHWREPPAADCVERRLGRPHLTWIFVSPWHAGRGVGTGLLAAAVRELRSMGFTHLLSTFLLGNDSSMLWHWRNGFELLPYPGSWRHLRKQWQP
jgi:GNAT superfamily N-acetyltransferase